MQKIPISLPDPVIHHNYILASDLAAQIPWSIERYQIPELWKTTKGKGVKVGLVDTGIDQVLANKGDLAGIVKDAKDFSGSKLGWADRHGHGSHTAGTIAGKNGTGVAPECDLYVAKALGDDGGGEDRWLAKAILWLVECGCKFINLSLGSPVFSQAVAEAVAYAASKGCLVIAAAGNSGDNVGFPARLDTCLSVGAVDDQGLLASFSCRGPEQDVAAPGVRILSCYLNGGYAVLSGTSMSSPFTVGTFVLAASAGYKFDGTAEQARNWLSGVTLDVGSPGQDNEYGLGLFDPAKVLKKPEPPAEPPKIPTEHGESIIDIGAILKKATGLDVPLKLAVAYPSRAGDLASISLKV